MAGNVALIGVPNSSTEPRHFGIVRRAVVATRIVSQQGRTFRYARAEPSV